MSAETGAPILLLLWAYAVAAGGVVLTLGIVAWWIAASRVTMRGKRFAVLAGALAALAPAALRALSASFAEPPRPAPPLERVPLAILLYTGMGVVALIAAHVRSLVGALAAGAGAAVGWVFGNVVLTAVAVALAADASGPAPSAWGELSARLLTPTLGGLVLAVLGGMAGHRIARRLEGPAPD